MLSMIIFGSDGQHQGINITLAPGRVWNRAILGILMVSGPCCVNESSAYIYCNKLDPPNSNLHPFREAANGKLPTVVVDIPKRSTDMSGITQEELQSCIDDGAQLFAE